VKRQVGGRTAVRPYDKSFVQPVKSHLWDNLRIPASALKAEVDSQGTKENRKSCQVIT